MHTPNIRNLKQLKLSKIWGQANGGGIITPTALFWYTSLTPTFFFSFFIPNTNFSLYFSFLFFQHVPCNISKITAGGIPLYLNKKDFFFLTSFYFFPPPCSLFVPFTSVVQRSGSILVSRVTGLTMFLNIYFFYHSSSQLKLKEKNYKHTYCLVYV